jgi:hypothetical protein
MQATSIQTPDEDHTECTAEFDCHDSQNKIQFAGENDRS